MHRLDRDSAADLCVAYVRGHSWVDSVVLGADTADQVRDQARLVALPALTPEQIARVRDELPAGSADLIDPARWRH
ncbi:Aldo/keto reductase family protein [Raineyella antarctica]|uniref:Aldo/keto reductase family protein n=1 Tax=Raineyella antarctica TaxID=1577474 RepID=A0A1G6GFU3_9ACTN|nr:Aldo/keto reductase family protein [Raineyella antarctica]